MSSLKIKNISKTYGQLDILKNIDINIEDGEFLVLVGPSGCGKSTTLRIIAGLEEPSEGEVYIGSEIRKILESKGFNSITEDKYKAPTVIVSQCKNNMV